MERKHLQAQLSYEEAIIAKECHVRNSHHKAKAVKEEVTPVLSPLIPFSFLIPPFRSLSP